MGFGTADVLLSALSVIVLATGIWAALRLAREAPLVEEGDEGLTDGAVVIADGGRITRAAADARRLLGEVVGQPLAPALARVLGEDRGAALAALERLERTGEPLRLLARDRSGATLELEGAPEGGQLRVVLRDAGLIGRRLSAAESELAEREAALRSHLTEHEALAALLGGAPLMVWSRERDGTPRWAGGAVATEAGTVTAGEFLRLLADREARLPRQGDGRVPARSRVEVTLGSGESLTLDVVEVPASEGGTHGFAVDGTRAMTAERTLGRFVQTMTETFAHLTVGLAIFDRNGTLALFNPALVQMWHVEASWLARRPSLREILDTLRGNRRIPEVSDFHEWRRGLLALFDDTEQVDYEELWHLADGSNIRVLARPHPHGSLAFVFDDVTERMRLEQRFRHLIELRRATLDRMDEGLAVFGADGSLQFVNAAFHRIWGTDGGTIGRAAHARDVVQVCSAASVEADIWDRALDFITADPDREPWSTRLTLGSGRILRVRVAALPGGASMIVCTDITDSEGIAAALRERNEALEAAEEIRTAVLDRVSRQLRTPLSTIFGFASLLAESRSGALTGQQREQANGILEAAGQLLDAIDDVTELAALQIEPLHDEAQPQRVWETLELTVGLLQDRALAAGATLTVAEPEEGAAHLVSDAPTLREIVFMMTAKALRHARRGSDIRLSARMLEETTLEVAVRHLGPAAPECDEAGGAIQPVLSRMIARAGGSYHFHAGPGDGESRSVCRLPSALPAGEEASPDPGPEPSELFDDDDAGPAA